MMMTQSFTLHTIPYYTYHTYHTIYDTENDDNDDDNICDTNNNVTVGATQVIFYNHTPLHNCLRHFVQLILLMLLMIDTSHINNFPYQLKFASLGADD